MIQCPRRLIFFVNLSLFHPIDQIFRFNIDHFHLIGMIEHRIRDPLAHLNPCDIFHHVVQTLQMLDIDRRINVDAGS